MRAAAVLAGALLALPGAAFAEPAADCRAASGEAAIEPCQAALEADRSDLESGFKLAWALLGHNQESDGIAVFRKLAEEHPEDERTHFNLAGALASVSAYKDASAPIERALEISAIEWEIQKLAAAIFLNNREYGRAHEMHRELAAVGDRTAMFDLAEDYALGRGTGYDQPLARHWYEEAAKSGHVGAMTVLAAKLESGAFGDPKDPEGAAYWRQQASETARGLPGWE
jgi:TPR repeat protein